MARIDTPPAKACIKRVETDMRDPLPITRLARLYSGGTIGGVETVIASGRNFRLLGIYLDFDVIGLPQKADESIHVLGVEASADSDFRSCRIVDHQPLAVIPVEFGDDLIECSIVEHS